MTPLALETVPTPLGAAVQASFEGEPHALREVASRKRWLLRFEGAAVPAEQGSLFG